MSKSKIVLSLAKVLIATAWSDGKISQEEINSLKDLIFRLPNITGMEWANLEMYIETPIEAEERTRLIENLKQSISSLEDKTLALETLQNMVEADGEFSEQEEAVVQEVQAALEEDSSFSFNGVGKFLKGMISRRTKEVAKGPNRELHFEDYIKNKIFYKVQQKLKDTGHNLKISDSDLRKLSLAGGMMARIAQLDKVVTEEESATIVEAFKKHWKVNEVVSLFITNVSLAESCVDLDYYRLTREFFATTTEKERILFLKILFDVARSDGEASYNETEEIRNISQSLKLDHNKFILAKTS